MPWQDYGLAGIITGTLLAAFVYWVKAARADLKESNRENRETNREFVDHLTRTGERQTEAIVASAVATAQCVKALEQLAVTMNRHDERAELRHQDLMREIGKEKRG